MSNWISLKDKLPPEYNWIIVGRIGENYMTSWTIARYYPIAGFEFWDNEKRVSCPFAGDSYDFIKVTDITHWIEIDQIEEDK